MTEVGLAVNRWRSILLLSLLTLVTTCLWTSLTQIDACRFDLIQISVCIGR
jgi:hypothetical protein